MHKSRETGTGSFGTRHCQAQFVPTSGRFGQRSTRPLFSRGIPNILEVFRGYSGRGERPSDAGLTIGSLPDSPGDRHSMDSHIELAAVVRRATAC
jgi:hypothetical protein